jgi:hypothetical protein
MKYYEIKYKNKTFNTKSSEFVNSECIREDKESVTAYVFSNIHKYNGNHAIGHGVAEVKVLKYEGMPHKHFKEKKDILEKRLDKLLKEIQRIQTDISLLNWTETNEANEEIFNFSIGELPSKESVIKDYCDGDLNHFNEKYAKYYGIRF